MREKDLEARLVQGVKALGGRAYKFTSPGNAGVPDRLVVLPGGIVVFAELKADGGKLSPMQSRQIGQLRQLGADVTVVRGLVGVELFLDSCREMMEDDDG